MGHVPAQEQRRVAVGVDAHRGQVGALCLQGVDEPGDVVPAVHGLAEAAEHNLPVAGQVTAQEVGQGLLPGGLVVQPQVVGVDAALVAVVPQAEHAGAVTAVGQVHVQPALVLIGDGLHTIRLLSGNVEKSLAVFRGDAPHLFGGQALHLGDGFRHAEYIP